MTIEAKFFSSDIAGRLRDGIYELAENATVLSLMDAAVDEAGIEFSEEKKRNFVFIYNNSPASADTELSDGGKLRILYKITGG